MKKTNARTLPKSTQEEKRRTGIKLWKKSVSTSEIADILDASIRSVQGWIAKYKAGGLNALKTTKHGRSQGNGRMLTQER